MDHNKNVQTTAAQDVTVIERRVSVLRDLHILDTPAEREFDEIVELAALICNAQLGFVTLLDSSRAFHKAHYGMDFADVPLEHTFCQYTVRGEGVMTVPDATEDPRFRANPFVVAPPEIRFYAGMPIRARGTRVGALCVASRTPQSLSNDQARALEVLGHQVDNLLERRMQQLAMQQMAAELQESRSLFQTVLDSLPIEAYVKASDGTILFYNRALAQRFGIGQDDWIGKTSFDIWPRETAENITREDQHVLRTGNPMESHVELPRSDGGTAFWRSTKMACQASDGSSMLLSVAVNVTGEAERAIQMQQMQDELERVNRELNSLALTDSLTGLWNRRAFNTRLEAEVIASHRTGAPLVLLMADVDNFKKLNDDFGHPYGDTVLKQVATLMTSVKRAEHIAVRFGGEEFAGLMVNTDIEGALAYAERLHKAMHDFSWEKRPVTISIGIAACTEACSAADLLHHADAALYQAKHQGKDCSRIYRDART